MMYGNQGLTIKSMCERSKPNHFSPILAFILHTLYTLTHNNTTLKGNTITRFKLDFNSVIYNLYLVSMITITVLKISS